MICGVEGRYMGHLHAYPRHHRARAGRRASSRRCRIVITAKGVYFLADTQIKPDPNAEEIAEMAILAAAHVRRFGVEPKIALLSRSDFGSYDCESGRKMRAALRLIRAQRAGARGRRRDERRVRAGRRHSASGSIRTRG